MKHFLTISLILLSLSSYSQTEMECVTGLDQWQGSQVATNIRVAPPVTDTIPCIMLVSDTVVYHQPGLIEVKWDSATMRQVSLQTYWGYSSNRVSWLRGYAVSDDRMHYRYLDSGKKPVTYFVWMSKNLK